MASAATVKSPKPQLPRTAAADAATSPPTQIFAMLSHRGRLRHANQDACAALPERGAFVVCDGMGGAAGGEIASHLAIRAFLHALRSAPKTASGSASASTQNGAQHIPSSHPETRLHGAVRAANYAVFHHSRNSPSLHGMGTTLVAALLDDAGVRPENASALLKDSALESNSPQDSPTPILWLVHVGDSRCYLLRRGTLRLLTQDHSLVEEQVRAGLLSRVQAVASPIRNIITRAVGSQPAVEPEIAAHATQPGDLYMLASDGLTRELDDDEIAQVLTQAVTRPATSASALESACQALIDAANEKGGRDNITVLLIAFP